MRLSRVLRISRPRFWIYELGPYMIGVLGAILTLNLIPNLTYSGLRIGTSEFLDKIYIIIIFAGYFLIPANIWIYGINDIYDYETDKLNPKKVEGYEALVEPKEQKSLRKWILRTTVPFIVGLFLYNSIYAVSSGCFHDFIQRNTNNIFCTGALPIGGGAVKYTTEYMIVILNNINVFLSFLAFLFFAGQYSAKPIRAKARPVLDSFFSAGHYIATAVFGYLLINPTGDINRYYVIAGMARAMAMHAFSAVPDIQADKDAKLATIATWLGGKATIWTCFVLYILAGILSYTFLGWISIILSIVYGALMLTGLYLYGNDKKVFALYKRFPRINTISGMVLFFAVLLKVIG